MTPSENYPNAQACNVSLLVTEEVDGCLVLEEFAGCVVEEVKVVLARLIGQIGLILRGKLPTARTFFW